MKPVRIIATDPAIDITIPMGDGPAYPVGGFGGWVTVPLQDGIEAVDWEGQEPLREDVPLLLNGLEDDEPVDRQWNTVKKLGRDPNGDERKPPVFRVWGPLDAPEGKSWVLPAGGIEVIPDEIVKRNGDGALLRIEFVLHLVEYIAPEVIKNRARRKKKIGVSEARLAKGSTYKVKKGDTLKTIAADLLGDADKWREIGRKNGLTDPNRVLPTGKVLKL